MVLVRPSATLLVFASVQALFSIFAQARNRGFSVKNSPLRIYDQLDRQTTTVCLATPLMIAVFLKTEEIDG